MRKSVSLFCRLPLLGIVDAALINAAIVLAFTLRFGSITATPKTNLAAYRSIFPVTVLIGLLIFYGMSLYRGWQHRSRTYLLSAISAASAGTTLGTIVLSFWMRQFAFPRSVLLLAFPLQVLLVGVWRAYLQQLHLRYGNPRRVLLVADGEEAMSRLVHKFMSYGPDRYILHGPIQSDALDRLDSELAQVDLVAAAKDIENRVGVIRHCAKWNKELLLVPLATDFFLMGATPEPLDDALMLSIRPPRLRPAQEFAKRMLDLVVSSVMLIFAAPVMALLWILIPLNSKGSAIFRQERLGLGETPYTLLKFRTMIADAENRTGPVLAAEKDPRITKLGEFLRATRLDELPQLINVVRGDMSMVGPRPEREFFVRQFEQEMPSYVLRMALKPGITGLAQVQGRYSTTAERKLRFDLLYICNYSLVLDLKILLQTVLVVLQREQAAGIKSHTTNVAVLIPELGSATGHDQSFSD